MKITVLYDNVARPPLREGWGFSALIETEGRRILFDAGADRLVLERNARALGVDLSGVTDIFLSHPHCDHVGGLSYVLEEAEDVRIWAPQDMEGYLRPRLKGMKAELIPVRGPRKLGEGLWSTGAMGRAVKEHGLVVATGRGPVLITGCAHPGIARMAARAARIAGEGLRLVLGGFHLAGLPRDKLSRLVRELGAATRAVAPGHCTGREATEALLAAFPGSEGLAVGSSWEFP